jgi:hypothetical protein
MEIETARQVVDFIGEQISLNDVVPLPVPPPQTGCHETTNVRDSDAIDAPSQQPDRARLRWSYG